MQLAAAATNIERHPGAGVSGFHARGRCIVPDVTVAAAAATATASLGLLVRMLPRRMASPSLAVMLAVCIMVARVTAAAPAVLGGVALVCATKVRPLVADDGFPVVDNGR